MTQFQYLVGETVDANGLAKEAERIFNEFYTENEDAHIVGITPQVIVLADKIVPTFVIAFHPAAASASAGLAKQLVASQPIDNDSKL